MPSVPFLSLCFLVTTYAADLPNTFPHPYSDVPSVDYGPAWQACELRHFVSSVCTRLNNHTDFEVTDTLPNVTDSLPRSFAGNIPVNREGHPNNTLFFWAFERSNGSLTTDAGASDDPWIIWLNGGFESQSSNHPYS